MNCDPNYLSQQSSSLLSLSDSQLYGAQIALTCAWFNALTPAVETTIDTEAGLSIDTEAGDPLITET